MKAIITKWHDWVAARDFTFTIQVAFFQVNSGSIYTVSDLTISLTDVSDLATLRVKIEQAILTQAADLSIEFTTADIIWLGFANTDLSELKAVSTEIKSSVDDVKRNVDAVSVAVDEVSQAVKKL